MMKEAIVDHLAGKDFKYYALWIDFEAVAGIMTDIEKEVICF